MTKYIKIIFFAIILTGMAATGYSQQITSYKAEDLMKRVEQGGDTLFIINFWATWCGPCIKELPEFDDLANHYKGKPVKILLVSLDFKNDYPAKIQKFVTKKKLQHEIAWLNETNANEFIPKIENEWQGSIPATLLIMPSKGYRRFYEGMIKSEQVTTLIDKQLSALY